MGRIALVTGASKGVGRGIAYGLAEDGWDVALNYNGDEAGACETASKVQEMGRTAWMLRADVGCNGQVTDMFAQLAREAGPVDLLVNNAGVQT